MAQIEEPVSVTSIPVPLTEPLSQIMQIPEWNRASKKITLDFDDFGQQDIYLRVYLCGKVHVQSLAKRFTAGIWVLGSGSTRAVVAADLVR